MCLDLYGTTKGAGEVIGGSWSSILFSLDVAAGLWPLLREGLRPSRLRPGALTRPSLLQPPACGGGETVPVRPTGALVFDALGHNCR